MTLIIQAVPTLQWASHEGNERSNPISIYAHTMSANTEYWSFYIIFVHLILNEYFT